MKKPSLNRARVKKLRRITNQINKLAPQMAALSDGQLKDYTRKFRQRLQDGESLDSLLVEAFAVVREADRRVLGMFPYDVQVMGGIALYQGNIVEMKTGEGKTLTATMPLYLNGLSGDGAMLVTPNEYLAYRDGTEMGQVYEWLGLTCRVGFAAPGAKEFKDDDKRRAYNADILYTTNATLGFDYLFDNLATNVKEKFIRDFNYAIVDEADAVLLDSAVMPLVISGSPGSNPPGWGSPMNLSIPSRKAKNTSTIKRTRRFGLRIRGMMPWVTTLPLRICSMVITRLCCGQLTWL